MNLCFVGTQGLRLLNLLEFKRMSSRGPLFGESIYNTKDLCQIFVDIGSIENYTFFDLL